jgi:hypothetical protein
VHLGTDNRKKTIAAAVLGGLALLVVIYQLMPSSSTVASTATPPITAPPATSPSPARSPRHGAGSATSKKVRPAQSLDPTLHLQQLAATEAIKYEGSGRNIFISQAEDIPQPLAPGATDRNKKEEANLFHVPAVQPPAPIPLKFFGFASHPGEPKRIFLSKGDDVFIAGEGEIVDRRYKVLRISPNSVEIQDVVGSGPPQSIPLTQG